MTEWWLSVIIAAAIVLVSLRFVFRGGDLEGTRRERRTAVAGASEGKAPFDHGGGGGGDGGGGGNADVDTLGGGGATGCANPGYSVCVAHVNVLARLYERYGVCDRCVRCVRYAMFSKHVGL